MNSKWFYLVLGGVVMIIISALLFGGFLHMITFEPSQWKYLSFFAFSGTASMCTGVLMMFDAATQKAKFEVKEAIKAQEGGDKSEAQEKLTDQKRKHIEILIEKSESLRPDQFKRNNNDSK